MSHIKFICGLKKHDIVMSKLELKIISHKMRSVKIKYIENFLIQENLILKINLERLRFNIQNSKLSHRFFWPIKCLHIFRGWFTNILTISTWNTHWIINYGLVWNWFKCEWGLSYFMFRIYPKLCILKSLLVIWKFKNTQVIGFCFLMQVQLCHMLLCVFHFVFSVWILIIWKWVVFWFGWGTI